MTRMVLYLPEKLRDDLKRAVEKEPVMEQRSMSSVIRRLIQGYLETGQIRGDQTRAESKELVAKEA